MSLRLPSSRITWLVAATVAVLLLVLPSLSAPATDFGTSRPGPQVSLERNAIATQCSVSPRSAGQERWVFGTSQCLDGSSTCDALPK